VGVRKEPALRMEVIRQYIAVLEPDEDGWTASVPDLPGCLSDGATAEEAEAGIREAIRLWIQTAESKGWPVPAARTQVLKIAV